MLVKHLVCVIIPAMGDEFDETLFTVPVYASGNNSMNQDPVKYRALHALAGEFASEDPDLHKHFIDKGKVDRINIENAATEFMVTDIMDIQEIDSFSEVQRSMHF
jgi:hypothetical protein